MIAAAKAVLRAERRIHRRALAAACPDAAARAAKVLARADLGPFATAAIYRAAGAEIDPEPLASWLEAQGSAIALPVVVRLQAPLIFRLRTAAALVPDALGIPAPPAAAAEVRPDLVVAPLLAFDRTGRRLGQGGGFYDRTLAQLRASGPVFALGLAYAGQEIDAAPADAYDQRLDGVLTQAGLRLFSGDE